MTDFYTLIPAAGVGSRMTTDLPKQYLEVGGRPVLQHVLDTFRSVAAISRTFVVVSQTDDMIDKIIGNGRDNADADSMTLLRCGGSTRRESVRNGLEAMQGVVGDDDWVLVHDAARPGLTEAMVCELIAQLRHDPVGGLLALPVVDTVKRAGADGRSTGTVARDGLWTAQTPQMFRYRLLRDALAQDAEFTDEASAVEAMGLQPKLVMGSPRNFKITLPADLALAGLYLQSEHCEKP